MKDLTHYFVSPPITGLNTEPNTVQMNNLENGSENARKIMDKKSETNVDNNDEINDIITKPKRSRVKIRISLTKSKNNNNNRCDIIESKNDVVDKTPSPFQKLTKKDDENEKEEEENTVLNNREDTPNAFKLLMTRKKISTTTHSEAMSTPISKECKTRLKQNKEKLVVLAERKGYSKRKRKEIEEAEYIENRLEKRAKLFRINDEKGGDEKIGETKKHKSKSKKQKKKNRNEGDENGNNDESVILLASSKSSIVNHQENNSINKHKKIRKGSDIGKNLKDCRGIEKVQKTDNDNLYSPFGKGDTTKIKSKWSLRVKFQSHYDDNDNDDDDDYQNDERGEDNNGNGNLSLNEANDDDEDEDDDYIFTPKSKIKFSEKKTRKVSNDVEAKEDRKSTDEIQKSNKVEDILITDSLESPKRGEYRIKQNRKKEKNFMNIINAGENIVEIIDDDLILVNGSPKIVQEKKLAPLFVRRSKPDPAAVKARRCFLQSGIPETVKKIIMDQKSNSLDLGTSSMPFPIISHVSQSQIESDLRLESIESGLKTIYREKSNNNHQITYHSFDSTQYKSLSNFGIEISQESIKLDVVKIERDKFETVLKDVESRCSDARKIWDSVSSTAFNPVSKKSPKRRTKKLKLQRKNDAFSNKENPEYSNPTWTCKYKPMNSVEVVGNESAISKLRNWLNGWRLPSQNEKQSSGDEFYSSDYSSSSYYENNQVAVLLGPYGSGKTASVYAIAEELGYRVLEVNASSRRTGKKILTNFQEATKSHRVKRDQSTLLMTKKKPSEKKVPQNSLILIEDVDLIFEEDEGFISATFQLAANTRRPIVMTCKEACSHLNKMAPQQQLIKFQTASGNRVSALLELIAFAESGYRLPKSYLNILLRNGDLRQSLLQLQYILLSGPPAVSQLGISAVLTWSDIQSLVYKPAIKSIKKHRKEQQSSKRDNELINSLANKLDNVSLISSLTELDNPASPPWKMKLNPSLSLLEDFTMYSNFDDLGTEIADWLKLASIGDIGNRVTGNDSKTQLATKRKVKHGIDLALSQAIPSTLEHRSTATDYLPLIRTMCRCEEERASINTKRGKRFHNYLHGLNLASASSNILAAASSVFRDKS